MRPTVFFPLPFGQRVRGVLAGALLLAAGCATAPQPVTKIVNGRVVTTRAVSPEAYEHVTRALLYEEEERWKEAADELQRALPFDPEAAEVRAQLAELFIRLDRLDDAAEQIGRSLQIAATVEGYLARAHLAQAYDDEAHHAQEIPALREAARLALAGDDPESIELTHLELSEAQVVALDLAGALDTARRLVDAVPETLRGRTQLAVARLGDGRVRSGGRGAGGGDRDRAERRRGAASCWPSCRSRPTRSTPRRTASAPRSIAPSRRWPSPTPSRAG